MTNPRPPVRVSTGARLHFGLMNTRAPFGGVGLMIDQPRTRVRISAAPSFDAGSVQPGRLTAIAQRLCEHFGGPASSAGLPPCEIRVEAAAPPHSGLGSGTQLALATATALATHFDLNLSRRELVETLADRGRRSAIGSFGFFEGGLIAEDGEACDYRPTRHWRRIEPPATWRVVLARPHRCDEAISGEAEGSAFASLGPAPKRIRDQLARLSEELIAAVQRGDFDALSETLTPFNRTSGELFADKQGGCYNGPAVHDLVQQIGAAGAHAYGQSSWGPTVFAFCRSAEAAEQLASRLDGQVLAITPPRLGGAEIELL